MSLFNKKRASAWITHKTTAILNQAAAVQNTWYTVLDTVSKVEVDFITIAMQTLAENLECRATVDGVVYTGVQASAIAGQIYHVARVLENVDGITMTVSIYTLMAKLNDSWKCRSFKFEVRKTSANGANELRGRVMYGLFR